MRALHRPSFGNGVYINILKVGARCTATLVVVELDEGPLRSKGLSKRLPSRVFATATEGRVGVILILSCNRSCHVIIT